MGKSQTMVSQGESGSARVSERYVNAVLKACGLPDDGVGPKPKRARRAKRGRKRQSSGSVFVQDRGPGRRASTRSSRHSKGVKRG
jgi:hypothetical protein